MGVVRSIRANSPGGGRVVTCSTSLQQCRFLLSRIIRPHLSLFYFSRRVGDSGRQYTNRGSNDLQGEPGYTSCFWANKIQTRSTVTREHSTYVHCPRIFVQVGQNLQPDSLMCLRALNSDFINIDRNNVPVA